MALQLPAKVGGKPIQIAYAPNATPDWQDVLILTDRGEVWHVWFRAGAGWQGPEHIAVAG